MAAFRVMTVDAEPAARTHLRTLLSTDPDCELISESSNGLEAIDSVEQTRPDIVIVDAQAPDVENDGFSAVRALSERAPLVIVTSPHGGHALRAFEAQVFDYLLKPIAECRFRAALARAKAHLANCGATAPFDKLIDLLQHCAGSRIPRRIAIRQNGRVVFVHLDEVDWIEAADNYVILHCGAETHILRETMTEVERRLDTHRFIRVHRSAIVNIDRIKELQPWFRGDFRVILVDGTDLILTRNNREKLDSRILLGALGR